MKKNKKDKTTKKEKAMDTKKNIVAFALVGLAVGTAAYFLFGTKEGRKQLDCAGDNFRKFSGTVRERTRDGAAQASRLVERAGRDIRDLAGRVKDYSKGYLDGAEEAVEKFTKEAEQKVKRATRKA